MEMNLHDEHEYIKSMLDRTAKFVSQEDLEKVRNTVVAQAGFGGVGAFILELLARWGIKKYRLLDMEPYEPSNLNRQIFATSQNLGLFKAEVAAERVKAINPFAEIEMIRNEKLTKDNVESFISGAGVIINGVDFPSGQIPLHYHAQKLKIPVINPHCMQVTEATVEVFDYRREDQQSIDAPTKSKWVNGLMHKYLNLFQFNEETLSAESLAKADERFKGKRGATLNYVTNLVACLAVAETIKLITGQGQQVLYPKQIMVDPYNLNFKIRSVYNIGRYLNYFKERVFKS